MCAESQSAKSRTRVLVADDQPVIRQMVKRVIGAHSDFEVVGEAVDGAQAVAEAEKLRPDVIVLNLFMPKMSGFEVAQQIRERRLDPAIAILSSHKNEQFISEARRVGAMAYVEKSDAGQELVRAIETAAKSGEFCVSEWVLRVVDPILIASWHAYGTMSAWRTRKLRLFPHA
jgi:two-component system, NarL family, nitrate/nitrite response regulator NarL